MPRTDLSRAELEAYAPERDEPADFDAFWAATLTEARQHPMEPKLAPVDTGLRAMAVYDVTFPGFGGDSIRSWLLYPAGATDRLPCVVRYIGYNGGRSLPHEWLLYPAAGYASLVMDNRGQGAGWLHGDTPDRSPEPLDPQFPGFLTRGIRSPHAFYYRRLVADAARAVEAAQALPQVDPERIAVAGASQGGGLALAAAGLADGVSLALVDVPFLCHFRRAVDIAAEGPYPEVASYCASQRHLADRAFATLSYVDGCNFATRATAPAVFSAGLMDPVCPPSTVYAAYHHYAGPKRMVGWPFNQHEGGATHQQAEHLTALREAFG